MAACQCCIIFCTLTSWSLQERSASSVIESLSAELLQPWRTVQGSRQCWCSFSKSKAYALMLSHCPLLQLNYGLGSRFSPLNTVTVTSARLSFAVKHPRNFDEYDNDCLVNVGSLSSAHHLLWMAQSVIQLINLTCCAKWRISEKLLWPMNV